MDSAAQEQRDQEVDQVRHRRRVVVLLATASLAGLGVYYGRSEFISIAGESAPRFSMQAEPRRLPNLMFADGDGRAMSLEQLRGKVVLLNIWATWCTPCRKEMPSLDRLQRQLGSREFEVVALSIDKGASGVALVKAFYKSVGVTSLRIYHDPEGAVGFDLGVIGVPATLLIDKEGRELGRVNGAAAWDSRESIALLERYTGRKENR